MRGRHNFEDRFLAARQCRFYVAFDERGEGFRAFPFRMLRSKSLHVIDREEELEIERLFRPKRSVLIESSDSFGWSHEVRASGFRDALDKRNDGLSCWTVVP